MNKTVKILLVSIVAFAASWIAYLTLIGSNFDQQAKKLQKVFLQQEKKLEKHLTNFEKISQRKTDLWENEYLNEHDFLSLCYQEENLVFWNSNKAPEDKLLDIKQSKSIVDLNNGIYYLMTSSIDEKLFISGFKIQSDYYYSNEYLQKKLEPPFNLSHEVDLKINQPGGFEIKNSRGNTVFYLTPRNIQQISTIGEIIIFFSFFIGFVLFWYAVGLFSRNNFSNFFAKFFIYPGIILIFEYLRVKYQVFSFFEDLTLFTPDLFAASEWFSNLGTTIISLSVFVLVIFHFATVTNSIKYNRQNRNLFVFTFLLFYFLFFGFAYMVNFIVENLVLNSNISFEFDNIFSINIYSVIGLLSVAIIFFIYIFFLQILFKRLSEVLSVNKLAVIVFISGIIFWLYNWFVLSNLFYFGIWPLIINLLALYISLNKDKFFGTFLTVLSFSIISFFIFSSLTNIDEKQRRKLFADQLISDKDLNLELDFNYVEEQIRSSDKLITMLKEKQTISSKQFINTLEKCCVSDLNDSYDIQVHVFDEKGENLLDYAANQHEKRDFFENAISHHGELSEVNEHLYFILDYFERFSYIGKIDIINGGDFFTLYLAFRSKKIPEEIGIPRLLMNSTAFIQGDLENYAIARYSNERLMMRFGNYIFPTQKETLLEQFESTSGFITEENNSFYIRKGDYGQLLVILKPTKNFFEHLTLFSYLFIFYSVIVLIIYLSNGKVTADNIKDLTLSLKIRIVLISLVVFSFVIFGIVTGVFVEKQYGNFTNDNLSEKLHSVHIEVNQKLGDKSELDKELLGTYMQYILKKFSKVFVTDINLYDNNGKLLASSQPNLFDKGIRAKRINSKAYKALDKNKKSEFIHTENLGNLSFYAAYKPLLNNKNEQLGFLNLQHFSKQRDYENQISGFLVTIINIAVLLLIITLIVALIISNWITKPLKLIQQSFKSIDFGKSNKPIDYPNKDEIGALVEDYNKKLIDLEYKALQLARSERETAWREMAKQVAHEIKNPLTPMRLRLQQFERIFNSNDPNAPEKFKKLSASLIEQIDGLTKIANEFSSFAKLPKANEEKMDIIPVLESCISVFQSESTTINFQSNIDEAIVFADKDLMIRVFNNILKNAIQATPEERLPIIEVKVNREDQYILLSFKDNGVGISREEESKIFVPNFTTKSTGAGLGLAMVKQIVQNHNGEIWFKNNDDIGTTFFVRLPASQEDE